jgi:ATP-dependent Lon protease
VAARRRGRRGRGGRRRARAEAALRHLLGLFEDYAAGGKRLPAELVAAVREAPTAERRAWGVVAHVGGPLAARQELLEQPTLDGLVARAAAVLAGEVELHGLERSIDERVRATIARGQREFWLSEQLKVIHQELGKDLGDADDADELEARVRAKGLPAAAEERALRELRRLRRMAPVSPEAGIARTFLDWVLALPWREASDAPAPDLARARAALDADHFGLDEVKERVLDYLAVLALAARRGPGPARPTAPRLTARRLTERRPTPSRGRRCCASSGRRGWARRRWRGRWRGRSGGRSRACRSAACATRRRSRAPAHVRGAQPGRVLQAMRKAGVADPVLLLDEVDKMGSDWRGDPSAALLEVLDPEQQHAFSDHFLELEYDLSRVLFITTANALARCPSRCATAWRWCASRVPRAEKLAIAERHLCRGSSGGRGSRPTPRCGSPARWPPWCAGGRARPGCASSSGASGRWRASWRGVRSRRATGRRPAAPARSGAAAARRLRSRGRRSCAPRSCRRSWARRRSSTTTRCSRTRSGWPTGLAYTAAGGELLEVEVSVVPAGGACSSPARSAT